MNGKRIDKLGYAFNVDGDESFFRGQPFWDVVQSGQWEPETFKTIKKYCSSGRSFIDIGAWIGPISLFAACMARHVYSVEPDPIAVRQFKANIALNPGLSKKITLFPGCISDVTGSAVIGNHKEFGNSRSSLLFRDTVCRHQAPSLTFPDFVVRFGVQDCSLIKMDVEGAEILIFPTMIDYLIANRPAVLISLHRPFYGENASRAVEIILDILKQIYPRVSMADGRSIDDPTAFNEPFFDLVASFDNG